MVHGARTEESEGQMATFAMQKTEALLENGLVGCGSCGLCDEPHRMRFNADGSQWLCREAAVQQTPCAEEKVSCVGCGVPTARKDLDIDGLCGCVAVRS
jgi:hypothetical protein